MTSRNNPQPTVPNTTSDLDTIDARARRVLADKLTNGSLALARDTLTLTAELRRLRATFPNQRLIRTVEDYDALPVGTVLRVENVKENGIDIFPGAVLVLREHHETRHKNLHPGIHAWAGGTPLTKSCVFCFADTLSVIQLGDLPHPDVNTLAAQE